MRLALLKNRLYVRAIENLIKQNKYHTLQYDTGYIHPKEYKKEVKKCVINQDKTLTVEELILINDIVKELGTTLKLFGNTQDQIEVLFSLKPHELERVAKFLCVSDSQEIIFLK
jgi:hypothetical protein